MTSSNLGQQTNAARFLKRLRRRSAVRSPFEGALEGAHVEEADVSAERIRDSLDRASRYFDRVAETNGANKSEMQSLARRTLHAAERGMNKLASEGPQAELTTADAIGLEAIIIADGSRPALFVRNDAIDVSELESDDTWREQALLFQHQIGTIATSVGRINQPRFPGGMAGTGFAIAENIIITNRHVLQAIASEDRQGGGASRWEMDPHITIDFAAEDHVDREVRFAIGKVLFAGPERIGQFVDLTKLDIAVLQCEPLDGVAFPTPLTLEANTERLGDLDQIYVMGFPAKPPKSHEDPMILKELFKSTYGVKRWAPGEIDERPGELVDGDRKWTFSHDASTLGGNSGSCIVEFENNGARVVGIHFGGLKREQNYAHDISKLQEHLRAFGLKYIGGP